MSIHITSRVWKHGPQEPGELLVLLALADQVNEASECYRVKDIEDWIETKSTSEAAR